MEDLGIKFNSPKEKSSIIKVIGVGGGGNNALKHMYEKGIKGVDFVVCNTDAQALDENPVSNKIQLGIRETEGLGAGADPEVGKKAALESIDEIKEILGTNTKMVFITAGMGGGTGTGAAPIIAKTAKEMGILTVGIVTVPFSFEGPRRLKQAEEGLKQLRDSVDSLIVINNDKLRQQFGNLGFKSGFAKADEILSSAAKGIAEVITGYFIVNIDFRDAKTVLQNSGTALMSEGVASGDNKAEEAVRKALDSPLLNDNKIAGAKDVLLLIRSGNQEVTMDEVGLINDHIQKEAGNSADIIWGIGEDESLEDNISVLVIATGFAPEYDKNTSITTERIIHDLDGGLKKSDKPLAENTADIENVRAEEKVENNTQSKKQLFDLEGSIKTDNNINNNFNTAVNFNSDNTIVLEEEEKEDETKEYNLFSYSDMDAVSYTFDFGEEHKEESSAMSFGREEVEDINIIDKEEDSIKFRLETRDDDIMTKKSSIEENPEIEYKEEEEFTIIEKKIPNSKIQERRDKLKDFNSRYQNDIAEEEEIFEIPTFKRRNLDLDLENVSDKKITSFISEDNKGKIEIKENKFLKKDVD